MISATLLYAVVISASSFSSRCCSFARNLFAFASRFSERSPLEILS
jgi:hypothetical protein